jgi:exopolyphosphatase/guanosine-5'-triphosphate,3'-diphosphate pyrophosphatase
MTMTPASHGTGTVVPRWEWRTFDDRLPDDEALAFLLSVPAVESEETYVLSLCGDASVKIREGVLDTKVLQRISAGLQLWVPTMKAAFPLAEPDLVEAFAALAVPPPATPRTRHSREEFVEELVGGRPDLRAVQTRKRRRRSLLDGCMIELTDISAGGMTTWSVAVESPDPDLVLRTIDTLGLAGRPNTCVATGLKTLLGWSPSRFAVIDVGTNSVKFLLGDRRENGDLDTVAETAVVTRLGEGLTETGELMPAAMTRTADAIEGLVSEARASGPVAIVAVGTAGLRQAPNRQTFLDAVNERCGVVVEVISGTEEARLAYRAAVSTLPLAGDRLLVFDSGGGSSQFTQGTAAAIEEQFSLDIGAVSVTERFGLADAVPRATVENALSALQADFERLRDHPRPDLVIAIGGTSTNLAAHRHRLESYDADVVHGTVLDLAEVDRQIEILRQLPAEGRRELPGLQPARAEVILAGACIVRTILTITGQDRLIVSDRGLRHGVAVERFGHTVLS